MIGSPGAAACTPPSAPPAVHVQRAHLLNEFPPAAAWHAGTPLFNWPGGVFGGL